MGNLVSGTIPAYAKGGDYFATEATQSNGAGSHSLDAKAPDAVYFADLPEERITI